MATITKLPSGKYRAQIRRQGIYQAQTFDRKGVAVAWAAGVEKAISQGATTGTITAPKSITVAKLCDAYAEAIGAGSNIISPLATICAVIGDTPVAGLNAYHLQRYIDARKGAVSGATIARALSVLSSCLRWARHVRHLDIDDTIAAKARRSMRAEKIKTSSVQRTRTFTPDELARIYAEIDGGRYVLPLRDLVEFALATSMRIGEITRITHEDIDGRSVIIRKRKHPTDPEDQRVPLTKPALVVITRQPTKVGRIFPYSANSVSKRFAVVLERAGVSDACFHDLRHTAVTDLFRAGLAIPEVSVFSGHKDWRNLKRYTNLTHDDVLARLEGEA